MEKVPDFLQVFSEESVHKKSIFDLCYQKYWQTQNPETYANKSFFSVYCGVLNWYIYHIKTL